MINIKEMISMTIMMTKIQMIRKDGKLEEPHCIILRYS
jgi:hypothetical protein